MGTRELPPYSIGLGVPGEIVSTREGYDRWSEVYDGDGNPLIALEGPELERMLGDVCGVWVAESACGTGRHCIRLTNGGAKVTARDFSEGMLARARTKAGAERVSFVMADC